MMVFLSVWLRRSNVLTGAEWIGTRFGNARGARLSHLIVVVFALVSVLGFLGYAFAGIGKFAQVFLPWDLSANTYALILMLFTGIYVIMGGFISVVATDVMQFVIMTITSIVIGIYKKYINPAASAKKYVYLSYLASLLVLFLGIGLGFIIETVDSITQWIVTALWAG